jgi:PTH1 family peptidyl-tRNA hydrolase
MFKISRRPAAAGGGNDRRVEKKPVRLLVGLGNDSGKYQDTFHNVGFLFADHLAKDSGLKFKKHRGFNYLKAGGLIVVKPSGFMNQSGAPTKQALQYFKVKPENLVLIHDDSDLPIGRYRICFGRGSAGHKGVESVFKVLKTDQFERVRIGVRMPAQDQKNRRSKAGSFILNRMSEADKKTLGGVLSEIKIFYSQA